MSRHCDTHGPECETFADLGHYCPSCHSAVHVDPLDDWSCDDICHRCGHARYQAAMVALTAIKACVDEQAEDEGLWSVPVQGTQRIAEAHLQQELRSLHRVIEEAVDAVLDVTAEEGESK